MCIGWIAAELETFRVVFAPARRGKKSLIARKGVLPSTLMFVLVLTVNHGDVIFFYFLRQARGNDNAGGKGYGLYNSIVSYQIL